MKKASPLRHSGKRVTEGVQNLSYLKTMLDRTSMTNKMIRYSLILLFLYSLIPLFSPPAHAETLQYLQNGDVATIKSLETLFKNLVQTVVGLSGVALFVMLLVGGFTFLFSGGDQKKLEQARGTITSAIIGLVLIVAGYLIIRTIEVFTGVPVTTFTIPTQ